MSESVEQHYYSIPQNFRMKQFRFEKNQLTLTNTEDIELFEKYLKGMTPASRGLIKTISISAADKLVRMRKTEAAQGPFGSDKSLKQMTVIFIPCFNL